MIPLLSLLAIIYISTQIPILQVLLITFAVSCLISAWRST